MATKELNRRNRFFNAVLVGLAAASGSLRTTPTSAAPPLVPNNLPDRVCVIYLDDATKICEGQTVLDTVEDCTAMGWLQDRGFEPDGEICFSPATGIPHQFFIRSAAIHATN